MNTHNRFTLTMICFGLLVAGGVLIKQTATSKEITQLPVERDYAQLNIAVKQVLEKMPSISEELQSIRSDGKQSEAERQLDKLFSVKKTEFRMRVENNLTKKEHSPEFLKAMTEKETNRYINALRMAKDVYGISVSQEEVTSYIDQNVSTVRNEEKRKYAEALGLTLKELDYEFDRDFYVMAVLWEKLIPRIAEDYPKLEGEGEQAYWNRVKEEFFSLTEVEK
ncbi:hypothetical protein [Sporosarcina obsidiansis]|uniref:hypothetical protein n=1 Tax=Sporosarcina obsidiansis TaxID=2660748 RepID=UPI00129B3B2D|nr:hypothetical protein [Sporosarcina obsidiansis]